MSDAPTNALPPETGDAARRVIAGLFYGTVQAEIALGELKAAGYLAAELSEVGSGEPSGSASDLQRAAAATAGATFFREHETRASAFASELVALAFSNSDAEHLVDSIVRGKTVVTVDTNPLGSGAAEGIFERHNATIYHSRSVAPAFALGESPVEELATDNAFEAPATAPAEATPERVLELREERLVVEKQSEVYAEATVSKRVVTEMQTIDIPVTREELVIERVPITSDGAPKPIEPDEPGEQIVIPLSQEVVRVDKRVVPIAEVTVGVRRVEGVEHVEETIRKEELVVDGERET
jgi:uncharacterized protein (TIGR02271 family)